MGPGSLFALSFTTLIIPNKPQKHMSSSLDVRIDEVRADVKAKRHGRKDPSFGETRLETGNVGPNEIETEVIDDIS